MLVYWGSPRWVVQTRGHARSYPLPLTQSIFTGKGSGIHDLTPSSLHLYSLETLGGDEGPGPLGLGGGVGGAELLVGA